MLTIIVSEVTASTVSVRLEESEVSKLSTDVATL